MPRDDARTPDMVDAEQVASRAMREVMEDLDIDQRTYDRMMHDLDPALSARANLENRGFVIPMTVRRRGPGSNVIHLPRLRG